MRKAVIDKKLCVACGCCLSACKIDAIHIHSGINAEIDYKKCVGCGMCVKKCPASIITLKEALTHA